MRAFPVVVADIEHGSLTVGYCIDRRPLISTYLSRIESICNKGPSSLPPRAVIRASDVDSQSACWGILPILLERYRKCDSCHSPSDPVFMARPPNRPVPCCRQPLVNALGSSPRI
jgi:hypothetical protein